MIVTALTGFTVRAGTPSPQTSQENELEVTLFDQPCFLRGPLNKNTLKLIHSISPEQIEPDLNIKGPLKDSTEKIRKSLERMKTLSSTASASGVTIPTQLEIYRERMTKRLEAELAFFDGLDAAKKTGKAGAMLELTSRHTRGKAVKDYETRVKKLEIKKFASGRGDDALEQLFEAYDQAIEPDPQEDFHRAIKRMSVRYDCTFEEESEDEEESE